MAANIQAGDCVGPYEVKGVLGSGALGIVYRARQSSLDRDVALKILSTALAIDEELVERFRREAKTAASLHHPNIVSVYDTGVANGFHYIAMELLAGRTLNELPLPLEPAAAVPIVLHLAEALAYAHRQGVVHRDLKPENAIINDSGLVTLTDFGVARVIGQASLTLGGGPIGTPQFMSPEQARGEQADARSDVYSLGLLLYYLLVGQSPFLAENALATMYRQIHEPLPPLPDSIPTDLRRWIVRCCDKRPDGRFPSASEALIALREAAAASAAAPAGPKDPLVAVLSGEMTLAEALSLNRDREAEIRSAFQKQVTAMSLDVVHSSLLKAPGDTILASFTFGALRRYVQGPLDRCHAVASVWSGDGLMAVFPSVDDALAAAREILLSLPEFNSSQSGVRDQVQVRIGLHTGSVLMTDTQTLGEVASPTLDLAGRLQKSAPPDTVLLSEVTRRQLAASEDLALAPALPGSFGPVYSWRASGEPLPPDIPLQAGAGPQVEGDGSAGSVAGAPPIRPPILPPIPFTGAGATMVRSGGLPVPATPPRLPVSYTRRASSWVLTGWAAFYMTAAISSFATHFQHAGVIPLWVASIIWASVSRRSLLPLSSMALTLSILGLITASAGSGMMAPALGILMALSMLIGISSAFNAAAEGRRLRSRRYVVLEFPDAGAAALSPAGRDRLAEEMSRVARARGFAPRELGLRAQAAVAAGSLNLAVQALHRDTGEVLAHAEVHGETEDAVGLASDIARRLSAQLRSPALPAGTHPAMMLQADRQRRENQDRG